MPRSSYSRTKGTFAGLRAGSGTVIEQDSDDNQAVYGDNVKPDDILEGRERSGGRCHGLSKDPAKYSKKRK
jgi:lipid-binding SYLF domain-containing protein